MTPGQHLAADFENLAALREQRATKGDALRAIGAEAATAHARIERNARGQVTAIWPLAPLLVAVERLASGRLRYRVRGGTCALLQEEARLSRAATSTTGPRIGCRSAPCRPRSGSRRRIATGRQSTLPPGLAPLGGGWEVAAAYLPLSATKFRALVDGGLMPKPERVGGRPNWDLEEVRPQVTILSTGFARPFTVAGYGNRLRDAITDAGLPMDCRPRGPRKAASRCLAEAGRTPATPTERSSQRPASSASRRIVSLEARSANSRARTTPNRFGEVSKSTGEAE